MAEKRKTAKNWRKAHKDAKAKVTRIETQITARLLDLVIAHPEVPVETEFDGTTIKAKSLNTTFVSHIDTNTRLKFIESIEKYLTDQHPHKQLTIGHVDVVPESPVGERVLVNGKTGEAYTRKPKQ